METFGLLSPDKLFYMLSNGEDFLSKHQLKCGLIYVLGFTPSKNVLNKYWEEKVSEQGISAEEFIAICNCQNVDEMKVSREAFQLFDKQQKGFISYDDFKFQAQQFLKGIPEHVKTSVFFSIDKDKDGRVTYSDFDKIFRCTQ